KHLPWFLSFLWIEDLWRLRVSNYSFQARTWVRFNRIFSSFAPLGMRIPGGCLLSRDPCLDAPALGDCVGWTPDGASFYIPGAERKPQGSLKTGQSGSLQKRPTVKARDIDVHGSSYRLCGHEQCFERREETTSHRTGKARMVFTKDRASNRCT